MSWAAPWFVMAPWRCRLNGVVLSGSPWLRRFGELSGFLSTRKRSGAASTANASCPTPATAVLLHLDEYGDVTDLCPCTSSPVLARTCQLQLQLLPWF
ncbi:hypothetical protein ACQJBY_005969 [Aegilops geniculata]